MLSVPFALSIHNFIHDVGADCGFAAIIAVALLVLLYFAHAREAANLRDGLDQAHGRIESLELRVQQLLHQQSISRQSQNQPTIAPAPAVAARPMGSALASLRKPPPPAQVVAAASTLLPAAPYSLGAPSLGSATKLMPDPPRQVTHPVTFGGVQDTAVSSAATAAGETVVGQPLVAAAAAGTLPAPAPRPGAATAPGNGAGNGAGSPPRVQIRPGGGAPPANGATAAGGIPRRTAPLAGDPRLADEPPRRSLLRRLVPVVIGVVIVAAVVVGLVKLTSNGTSGKAHVSHHTQTSKKGGGGKTPVFKPADWTVSVLNGTSVDNLAADVGNKLSKQGFKQGSITNAASQTETFTTVYYRKPAGKPAALHVAKTLGLSKSRVKPATPGAVKSCATNAAGTTVTCKAQLIVSVGTDEADLAGSGSSSS